MDECNDDYIIDSVIDCIFHTVSFYECYDIFTFVWTDDGAAD